MKQLIPCLWFDGNAEDAVSFYCSVFPDSDILESIPFNDAGPGESGSVMMLRFRLRDEELLALNGGPHFSFTPAVSISVQCKDQAEVDYYWEALLANGGEPSQCGWLTDQFGLSWQIVPEVMIELIRGDSARAATAMQAMFPMQKIDIATVLKAVADA